MGVPAPELPRWHDIQFVTAQLARAPQLDDVEVGTKLVVGPKAARPLALDIPILVSDMSFGALSEEAKVALARGAERAGTGICSGEGGMLPEEQQANGRYFYELASGRFGFSLDKLAAVQAFHFKGGQAAKTGTGGPSPQRQGQGPHRRGARAARGQGRDLADTLPEWDDEDGFRHFADEVKEATGGIPVGFKLSAQHIEDDIDAGPLDRRRLRDSRRRGGATGGCPTIFRDNISVPTLPALARARRHLDERGRSGEVTLIITGGLRTPADFAKALALGADGIAVSNAAIQAVGCLAMRACHTNNCPVGIATQKPHLRARLDPDEGALSPRALPHVLGRADEASLSRVRAHRLRRVPRRGSHDLEA